MTAQLRMEISEALVSLSRSRRLVGSMLFDRRRLKLFDRSIAASAQRCAPFVRFLPGARTEIADLGEGPHLPWIRAWDQLKARRDLLRRRIAELGGENRQSKPKALDPEAKAGRFRRAGVVHGSADQEHTVWTPGQIVDKLSSSAIDAGKTGRDDYLLRRGDLEPLRRAQVRRPHPRTTGMDQSPLISPRSALIPASLARYSGESGSSSAMTSASSFVST